MQRVCGNCALKALKHGVCPVFNANMEDEQGCPYFTTEVRTCDVCGTIIPRGGVLQEEDNAFHIMCQGCAAGVPCSSCTQVQDCRLNNDQSCPEPLYVMVLHRDGKMVIQTQQLNPKRIQATCAQGCNCFNAEGLDDGNFCFKMAKCGCKNYKTNWRN